MYGRLTHCYASITDALKSMNFFFSSRRRHTRWNCDWSSDVCSSDLLAARAAGRGLPAARAHRHDDPHVGSRSEERRVGKECRSRWSRYPPKKQHECITNINLDFNFML